MNKIVLVVAGAVIAIAAVGGGIYLVTRSDEGGTTSSEVQTGEEADAGATKTACDVLTAAVAQEVIGAGARQAELPAAAQASNDDVSVSNCIYDNSSESASVLVRGGKTATGKDSNKFGFEDTKTSSTDGQPAENIDGLGESAWYNPAFGQVNVLLDDGTYWLIVQAGSTSAGDRAKSEQLARLVVENF